LDLFPCLLSDEQALQRPILMRARIELFSNITRMQCSKQFEEFPLIEKFGQRPSNQKEQLMNK